MKIISVVCCLLWATVTEGAEINVEGEEGGEVSFRCSHKVARTYHKYLCKDPCKKNADILLAVKPGKTAESGRITLEDSGDGGFTVTFSQLQLSDSGKYFCGVNRNVFHTYTEIQLTVKEAVSNKTTTTTPDVSPTWIHQDIANSTQFPGTDTSRPTNFSTASNFTEEEEAGGDQNISTGTLLYVIVGGLAMLIILMLATRFRKCREIFKPQPRVCSNSTSLCNAHEREVDCGNDDNRAQGGKSLSQNTSVSPRHPRQPPPRAAPTAAERRVPLQVYENISFSKDSAGSRSSPAHELHNQNSTSEMYLRPLPPVPSERKGDGRPRKHNNTNKPTVGKKRKKKPTSDASPAFPETCESTEERRRSLWFGLDLSGINQS